MKEEVEKAVAFLRTRAAAPPSVGIVLGSGLGGIAEAVRDPVTVPTREIPFHPPTTVEGHEGAFVFGELSGKPALVIKGRVHAYEGYELHRLVFPIRVAALAGVRTLILTNAAGGIREDLTPGSIMMIGDHLNLFGRSPLEGLNVNAWGPRFPDMTDAYDPGLRNLAREEAGRLGIALKEGVYAACRGPEYETPAEVRMLRTLGADAVGMSTVPEAIAARHMGLRLGGFSLISNKAAGLSGRPITHEEVLDAGAASGESLARLLLALVARI